MAFPAALLAIQPRLGPQEHDTTRSRLCTAIIDIIRPLRFGVVGLEGGWLSDIIYQIRREGLRRSSVLVQLLTILIEDNLPLHRELPSNDTFLDFLITEALSCPDGDCLYLLMKLSAEEVSIVGW